MNNETLAKFYATLFFKAVREGNPKIIRMLKNNVVKLLILHFSVFILFFYVATYFIAVSDIIKVITLIVSSIIIIVASFSLGIKVTLMSEQCINELLKGK
jgi:hypothetical protein